MISVTELQQAMVAEITQRVAVTPPSAESKPLLEALGYVLSANISAAFDWPRQNVSAMDGYAFPTASTLDKDQAFRIVGESIAGQPFSGDVNKGEAVRIMTGAVLPAGCDTVVMQENTRSLDDKVVLTQAAKTGINVRLQGEEISAGETLINVGTILTASQISLLANMGVSEVSVYRPLKIGLLASGDELKAVGQPLTDLSQIYNSNTPTLDALMARLPVSVQDYGIMADDLAQTKTLLARAANESDLVITSAGVSVGDYDYLTTAITELGRINHYKVAMKPGKPFVFGEIDKTAGGSALYFGLPGNPISTFVTFLFLVRPALWQLAGAAEPPQMLSIPAVLTAAVKKRPGRRDFQRGLMTQNPNGDWQVAPLGSQDSHRIKSLAQANCLIDLPQDAGNMTAGERVIILPLG